MLEIWSEERGLVASASIDSSPFTLGRDPKAALQLAAPSVSKLHARIVRKGSSYWLADLESRNGTFLGDERLAEPRELTNGDRIRVGGVELRFVLRRRRRPNSTVAERSGQERDPDLKNLGPLLQALQGEGLRPVFQSLHDLPSGRPCGYEALTWSKDADRFPFAIMQTAERVAQSLELSRVMRDLSLAAAARLPAEGELLFLNVHPEETAKLEVELPRIVEAVPAGRRAVLEIHETAIVEEAEAIRRLRDALHDHGALMAYDDVGAGRSRLREIADCPPDIVKLDRSMISGIDTSAARQQLVEALVTASHALGTRIVAEGVETEAELIVCGELGIDIAQGFFLARPAPPPPAS
ncbi:MAG: EAL domain-containing protein [Myxococcota bacterium]